MKKYNIIDNQIKELKNKGLKLKNEELAKQILLKENYYFLTHGYEEIFLNLKKSNNTYLEDTYFEELYAIYNFDRELKNLILDYINIIETKIKSVVAYEYTEKYGEDYLLNENNLDKNFKSTLTLQKLTKQVEENIERNARNSNDLKQYINKDGKIIPLVLIKYFTFGNIINLYSILKEKDQQNIAKYFKQNNYTIEKHLKILNVIRNICAHNGVLFNYKHGKSDIYFITQIMKVYLDKESFNNMFIRIENLLLYVKEELDGNSYNNLIDTLGFSNDYKSTNVYKEEKVMEYEPKSIDTSDVVLSEEILNLAEKLAENTHEIWAIGRMSEGWKYGTVRDDKLKTTPCLVPYNKLPEREKEYDRNTALETLKLIQKLGFKIIKED